MKLLVRAAPIVPFTVGTTDRPSPCVYGARVHATATGMRFSAATGSMRLVFDREFVPLSNDGYISEAEYECLYSEALAVVRERYGRVSAPYFTAGARLCDVAGVPADDQRIFELCWNADIARQISRERRRCAPEPPD